MGGSIARLLLLAVAFHALCVRSIFDVYFQSTVELSVPSVNYTASAPAKRVVIFTFDGCRVDKLFKAVAGYEDHYNLSPDGAVTAKLSSDSRAPFLGNVMRHRGSWGVSHNHAPTESRPCHVALTAGMYEDPHAVSTSWKQHPVPFDSVFNQSNNAFIYGNKDVAPMLARHAPQATEEHYTAREESEMVREDTTLLDVWAYRKVKELFARGTKTRDVELYNKLHQDKLVIYCHFLGTDLTGPKYGADSREYLENIAVVDELIEKTEKMIDEYYGHDNRTAFVVTADHGMDLRGDHGNKDPSKARTAIIAWGAGVQGPIVTNTTKGKSFDIDLPTQSKAEVQARLEKQTFEEKVAVKEWQTVTGFRRKDIMQTDVAALISALAGLSYPRNSVGVLPFSFLSENKYRAVAIRANAQQLYQHALRKEEVKRAQRGLLFIPYSPLHNRLPDHMDRIDEALQSISEGKHHLIHNEAHRVVEMLSQEMIDITRNAIVYYQTYDSMFLLGSVVLGYIGLTLVMTVAYLHPTKFRARWLLTRTISVKFVIIMAAMMWWRFLANSPSSYYMFGICPLFFWKFVWRHRDQLQAALPIGQYAVWQWGIEVISILLCLELVVLGYQRRAMFSLLFVLLALWPRIAFGRIRGNVNMRERLQWRKLISPIGCWSASCLLIAVFPCLPMEYAEEISLVHFGALMLFALAYVVTRSLPAGSDKTPKWRMALQTGVPVLMSLASLQWTTRFLDSNAVPPLFLVISNWTLATLPPIWLIIQTKCQNNTAGLRSLNFAGENDLECQQRGGEVAQLLIHRLMKVVLAFSPAYILLSTGYETLFYVVLCSALMSWLMLEAKATFFGGISVRREVQRALLLLLFVQISFFGINSVARMTSFQISSSRRFLFKSSPSIAQALVVLKLFIPFAVAACAFRLILMLPSGVVSTREKEMRGKSFWVSRYFLLAVSMADILAIQCIFLVDNEGSWKEMGNSIAEFCIVNAQIVLLPTIVYPAWAFVHDLDYLGKGYDLVEADEGEKTQ
ncbi:unnamed protein product [Phytophthora lilii]|uniref:GPI ethanolamine phosphate transferase 1 n=1 Tax=Phytophthora lilii TaxID=2077276 RepID=A0A9W6TAM7_9STRA|nr:unnamed protein product [Phytophthora lilii]